MFWNKIVFFHNQVQPPWVKDQCKRRRGQDIKEEVCSGEISCTHLCRAIGSHCDWRGTRTRSHPHPQGIRAITSMCKVRVWAESSVSFPSPHKMCISAGDIWELVMKVKQLKGILGVFTGLHQPQVPDSSTRVRVPGEPSHFNYYH